VQEYPLEEANRALRELKERKIRGAKVLRVGSVSRRAIDGNAKLA